MNIDLATMLSMIRAIQDETNDQEIVDELLYLQSVDYEVKQILKDFNL